MQECWRTHWMELLLAGCTNNKAPYSIWRNPKKIQMDPNQIKLDPQFDLIYLFTSLDRYKVKVAENNWTNNTWFNGALWQSNIEANQYITNERSWSVASMLAQC